MKYSSVLLSLALAASASPIPPPPTGAHLAPRASINDILAWISKLFPASIALAASKDVISAADAALALLLGDATTANDLTDGGCGDVTLVWARGTDEPGNVGVLAGPEFYAALQSALASAGTTLVFQGVDDYDASVTEYLEGGSKTGAANMASLVTQAFSQCPDTKVVMGGYSQGAQVVHLAASDLPVATMKNVSAVVTFGDPNSSTAVANIDSDRVLIICHDNDDICQFGDLILLPHLTYSLNATAAASFVVDKI